MLASNDEIYNIFRRDLHLSEEKTRKLAAVLDTSICDTQSSIYVTKVETLDLTVKLERVIIIQENMQKELGEVKAGVTGLSNEIKSNYKDTIKSIFAAGFIQFIITIGGLIGIISFMLRK
ncbi:hypothetical protein HHL17_18045 [Chitinophaga sp. G-6-1-13]|uniref:Uncharacterized protein n=1 Tax=Chitinophaga fulva TaxID=2728842 RepID=A0A848GP14_9BACT|nr:hypothetical protein [Chitinophaga fulva]NML39109.1 hypothetical protein [Chitinophaga fulva]